MKKNVGTIDMVLRLAIGVAIGIWGLMESNWFGLIGVIPIGTALLGTCPAYTLFGISSCKVKE
ncbi:DUF2892 domain-containing protein [Candidatus Kapaibacterium sp.]